MTRLTGHYDGKVIVPDEALDIPAQQRLTIHVEPLPPVRTLPRGISGEEMATLSERLKFDPADLDDMERAIDDGCERIDHDGW